MVFLSVLFAFLVPSVVSFDLDTERTALQVDISHLRKWIGKTETATDFVTPAPIAALSATLDIEAPHPLAGDAVRLLWHWLYFLETHRQSELGPDGHAKLGGFLPPVPLPRRMWAGGRFEFMRPLRVGETFTRTSRIVDVQEKKGRTGALVFVLVRHEIGNSEGIALVEEQDLVYRDHAKPGDPYRRRSPRPQARSGNAPCSPMMCFCSAIPRSRSTAIEFTTTAALPPKPKDIPGWLSMAR